MKKIFFLVSLLSLNFISAMEKPKELSPLQVKKLTPQDLEAFIIQAAQQVKNKFAAEEFKEFIDAWSGDDLKEFHSVRAMSDHNRAPTGYSGAVNAIISPNEVITDLKNGKKFALPMHDFIACMHTFKRYPELLCTKQS